MGPPVTTRQEAAITHLRMLQLERNPEQDALYVRLAFTYGLGVTEISDASGLSAETVSNIIRTIRGGN